MSITCPVPCACLVRCALCYASYAVHPALGTLCHTSFALCPDSPGPAPYALFLVACTVRPALYAPCLLCTLHPAPYASCTYAPFAVLLVPCTPCVVPFAVRRALCPVPCARFPMPYALRPMPCAVCHACAMCCICALYPMGPAPSALWPCALCPMSSVSCAPYGPSALLALALWALCPAPCSLCHMYPLQVWDKDKFTGDDCMGEV